MTGLALRGGKVLRIFIGLQVSSHPWHGRLRQEFDSLRCRVHQVLPHEKQLANDAEDIEVHAKGEKEAGPSVFYPPSCRHLRSLPELEDFFQRGRTRAQREDSWTRQLDPCRLRMSAERTWKRV